jgi:uncharacterized protein (UPF0332 family)
MVSLAWCKKQKSGIKIVEPNENLSNEYLKSAEETLIILRDIGHKSNMWKATMKYYCEYFAVYALLLRIGLKCEIHDCTIKLCEIFEKSALLPKGIFNRLESDKNLRIDNQYYLKNTGVVIDFSELADFILQMKNICFSLTNENI